MKKNCFEKIEKDKKLIESDALDNLLLKLVKKKDIKGIKDVMDAFKRRTVGKSELEIALIIIYVQKIEFLVEIIEKDIDRSEKEKPLIEEIFNFERVKAEYLKISEMYENKLRTPDFNVG